MVPIGSPFFTGAMIVEMFVLYVIFLSSSVFLLKMVIVSLDVIFAFVFLPISTFTYFSFVLLSTIFFTVYILYP